MTITRLDDLALDGDLEVAGYIRNDSLASGFAIGALESRLAKGGAK